MALSVPGGDRPASTLQFGIALCLLLIAACGAPPGAARSTPGGLSAAQSPGPVSRTPAESLASPEAASGQAETPAAPGSVTPAPTAGLSSAGFPCRLPLDKGAQGAYWISIPGPGPRPSLWQPVADPKGAVSLPGGQSSTARSYSWRLRRWLPVAPEWVAPDGTRYAYADRAGALRMVDATTDSDRLLDASRQWAVVAFQADGIYAAAVSAGSASAIGLWRYDLASSSLAQLRAEGSWVSVAGGAAWAVGPSPPATDGSGSELRRLDIATGGVSTWYSRTDARFRFVGLDLQGEPYLQEVPGPGTLWLVTAPGAVLQAYGGVAVNSLVDGQRVWIAEQYGPSILLGAGASLQIAASAGSGSTRVAGPCR